MHPVVVACFIVLAIVAAVGVAVTASAPSWPTPPYLAILRGRVQRAVDECSHELGRGTAAVVVLAAGFGGTIVLCYLLGKGAQSMERAVDWPAFVWFRDRQLPGAWTEAWKLFTQMGNRSRTQPLTLLGAGALAVLWGRRGRWWLPCLILPAGYLFEKLGQMLLAATVHRGHPPTTLGTWPSGGCARLTVVYGLILFLALRWHRASLRTWMAGWSVLAFLAAVEAYSRVYLLKHWLTDVVGGLIYGTLVLVVLIGTATVLDRRTTQPPSEPALGQRVPAGTEPQR